MAWETPINITQETYDREYNNISLVKQKRPRLDDDLSDFINLRNNDPNNDAIIIHNINLPPIECRPCVMFTGFDFAEQQQQQRV